MPANIPSPACASLQSANAATGNIGNSPESSSDSSAKETFGAIFMRLSDKQSALASSQPGQASPKTEKATAEALAIGDMLAVLLPFLEAMGLTTTVVEEGGNSEQGTMPREMADEAGGQVMLAGMAASLPVQTGSMPAISAAEDSAYGEIQAMTSGKASSGALFVKPETPIFSQRQAEAGNEFSAQLVAAIETSKEQPRSPGSTAAAIQQVIANHLPQGQHASIPSPHVTSTIGTPGWSEEIGNRIVWMANRMESRAELVLTPPQMGRVEVSLSINGDLASATFISPNPVVREALEAALPRLREVLAEAGIQLGQAQVGAQSTPQWAQQEKNGDNYSAHDHGASAGPASQSSASGTLLLRGGLKWSRGLVDVFA